MWDSRANWLGFGWLGWKYLGEQVQMFVALTARIGIELPEALEPASLGGWIRDEVLGRNGSCGSSAVSGVGPKPESPG